MGHLLPDFSMMLCPSAEDDLKGLQKSPLRYVPVGQESPMRGIGVWAEAVRAAISKMKQGMGLIMATSRLRIDNIRWLFVTADRKY